jgi:hypothetical protein
MQINTMTKTVRTTATIAPPMPDYILVPWSVYKRIWFIRRISLRISAITESFLQQAALAECFSQRDVLFRIAVAFSQLSERS